MGQQAADAENEEARDQPAGIEEILVEGQAVQAGVSVLAVDVARFGTQVQVISADECDRWFHQLRRTCCKV